MTQLESTLRSPGDNEIYIRFSIYKPTHTRKIIRRNNYYYTSKKIKYLGLKEHGVNLSEVVKGNSRKSRGTFFDFLHLRSNFDFYIYVYRICTAADGICTRR